MSNEQVQKITEIVQTIMENKETAEQVAKIVSPVIKDASKLIMDTFGPNVENVLKRLASSKVSIRKHTFDEYIKNGFSPEQAITFMLSDAAANVQSLVQVGQRLANGVSINK